MHVAGLKEIMKKKELHKFLKSLKHQPKFTEDCTIDKWCPYISITSALFVSEFRFEMLS